MLKSKILIIYMESTTIYLVFRFWLLQVKPMTRIESCLQASKLTLLLITCLNNIHPESSMFFSRTTYSRLELLDIEARWCGFSVCSAVPPGYTIMTGPGPVNVHTQCLLKNRSETEIYPRSSVTISSQAELYIPKGQTRFRNLLKFV
jgi:hypothetical protein